MVDWQGKLLMSKKIVVIGGVAAGATAAAKARRTSEDFEIVMIEKGNFISYANCGLPYHVGGVIPKRNSLLLHTPKTFGKRFNTDVKINTEALSIDAAKKEVLVRNVDGESIIPYDKLIIANGAKSVIPPISGIDSVDYFSMRTVDDMDAIKKYIEEANPESAVIIGGGYIGIETAEAMYHCNIRTTLIEAAPHIIPIFPAEVTLKVKDEMSKCGVDVLESSLVTDVCKSFGKVLVTLNNGNKINTDMLILCTGVKPDTALAETAGIKIGRSGGVIVNEKMETSVADIYAAGDLVEKTHKITGNKFLLPLAGAANREGRTAGCNAAGGGMIFPGVIGTSIVGFNDACVAHTGLTLDDALKAGFNAKCVYTEDAHRVTYFPDPRFIFLKLVFDESSGKILGATASGTLGVERRIDVISTAIYGDLTVYDLENIELCYAPPYGAAKDSVNIAGFVASNQLRNQGFGIMPDEFLELKKDNKNTQVVDVRTRIEYKTYHIEDALNIYINDLRGKLDQIDKSRPVYLYCAVGFRGYLATRILRNLGIEAYNVLGGIEAINRIK